MEFPVDFFVPSSANPTDLKVSKNPPPPLFGHFCNQVLFSIDVISNLFSLRAGCILDGQQDWSEPGAGLVNKQTYQVIIVVVHIALNRQSLIIIIKKINYSNRERNDEHYVYTLYFHAKINMIAG